MNSRLQQFLSAENITQSQFADNIGVARASVSHILAGRNKPGFDFLENTARHYPSLNISWLITGKGRMYSTQSAEKQAESPFQAYAAPSPLPVAETETPAIQQPKATTVDTTTQLIDNKKSISKILIFYSDNSFEEFKPSSK